jgi:hypothetical protein
MLKQVVVVVVIVNIEKALLNVNSKTCLVHGWHETRRRGVRSPSAAVPF